MLTERGQRLGESGRVSAILFSQKPLLAELAAAVWKPVTREACNAVSDVSLVIFVLSLVIFLSLVMVQRGHDVTVLYIAAARFADGEG